MALKAPVVSEAVPLARGTGDPRLTPFDWNCTDPVGAGELAGAVIRTVATVVCPIAILAGVSVMVPVEAMSGSIVMLNAPPVACEAESVTCSVKFVVPAVVGVPEITPCGESDSPVGNTDVPDKLHV